MRGRAVAFASWVLVAVAPARGAEVTLDRTIVRFDAPETGGALHPRFVFERELAFEARLEASSDSEHVDGPVPYLDRHVRAAIERHVAEELLANLAMDPEPTPADIDRRLGPALAVLEQRVGGRERLDRALAAEGLDATELDRLVRREARASLYVDRMIAPMLEPSEAELMEVHRSTASPFRGRRFDEVVTPLRRWYVAERLSAALGVFYQNARARVHVVVLPRASAPAATTEPPRSAAGWSRGSPRARP